MLLRVTGPVLRVDARSGISKRTNEAYRIPFAVILVENQGVAEVNIPDTVEVRTAAGEFVDWCVEVSAFGGNPQARYVSDVAPLNLDANSSYGSTAL